MQLSSVYATLWLRESCHLDILVPRRHLVRAKIPLSRGVVRLRCTVNGIQSGMKASLEGMKASLEGMKASLEGVKASLEGVKASLDGMNGSLEHAEDSFLPVY